MSVRPRKISTIKSLFGNLAQTSHYEVKFNSLPKELMRYLNSKGIDPLFITRDAGLLCFNALLPTTNLATFTVDGNHMGIQEKFAHTRIYSPISLDFYVDKNYKMLNFLEYWMEFIASGSYNNQLLSGENVPINMNSSSYFIRMQYPQYYKANSVQIIKFDRDYNREIEYNFRGFFPENMSSIPVTYSNSEVLKVSISFLYDRYIAGKTNTFNQFVARDSNGRDPKNLINNSDSQLTLEEINQISNYSTVFTPTLPQNSITPNPSQQANPGSR